MSKSIIVDPTQVLIVGIDTPSPEALELDGDETCPIWAYLNDPESNSAEPSKAEIEDVRAHGVRQTITVVEIENHGLEAVPSPATFVVDGRGRVRRARLAGVNSVPAMVQSSDETDPVALAETMVKSNFHRRGLSPMDKGLQAERLRSTLAESGLKKGAITKRLKAAFNCTDAALSQWKGIAKLPENFREAFRTPERHGHQAVGLSPSLAYKATRPAVLKRNGIKNTSELASVAPADLPDKLREMLATGDSSGDSSGDNSGDAALRRAEWQAFVKLLNAPLVEKGSPVDGITLVESKSDHDNGATNLGRLLAYFLITTANVKAVIRADALSSARKLSCPHGCLADLLTKATEAVAEKKGRD